MGKKPSSVHVKGAVGLGVVVVVVVVVDVEVEVARRSIHIIVSN